MYDELPHPEPHPELVIINREEAEESNYIDTEEGSREELEKAKLEARAYAEKIKGWIGDDENQPLQVVDKATHTKLDEQYRDIVILHRTMSYAPSNGDNFK